MWGKCFTHQRENCLSSPLCLTATPFLWKEYGTPFKRSPIALASIWKRTPLSWSKDMFHSLKQEIAHPQRLHPLNGKLHPQGILRMFIIQALFQTTVVKHAFDRQRMPQKQDFIRLALDSSEFHRKTPKTKKTKKAKKNNKQRNNVWGTSWIY